MIVLTDKKDNFNFIVLIAAVFAGVVLRINGIFTTGIWYDEALPFAAARLPFWSMLEATKFTDAPPLWDLIIWCSVRILGQNEVALRLPSLIASVITLWLAYKVSGEFLLSNLQKTGLMIFICILPYQIWMAQDGRSYALFSALYLAGTWFALRKRWLGLTACGGLILFSHYVGLFYVLSLYIVASLTTGISFKNLKTLVASGFIAVLSFAPWVPVYMTTLAEDFTVPPLTIPDLLVMFYRIMFADALSQSSLLLLALIAISGCLLLSEFILCIRMYKIIKDKLLSKVQKAVNVEVRYIQLSLFALLPLVIMVTWSIVWKNFIYYRLLVPLAIPLILWMLFTLTKQIPVWLTKYFLIPIWSILLVVGVANWSPLSKDGNMHNAIDVINTQWKSGDVIYHITGTSYMPFSNYFRNKPMYLIDEQQHGWLLRPQLQDIFGVERSALEDIKYKRVWVFYASSESLISENARRRADQYIENGVFIDIVQAWQFAPIKIYLVDIQP
jgi:uncharacterized membrane protein